MVKAKAVIDQEQQLKSRVLEFLKTQPLRFNEPLEVSYSKSDHWYIQYGDNIQSGIAAFGDTLQQAYDDFLYNWEYWKGDDWIEYNRQDRRFPETMPFDQWRKKIKADKT